MCDRVAMLGPLQQTVVGAVHDAVNVQPFLDVLPKLSVPDVWYSSIIQSGIEKLEIPIFPNKADQDLIGDIIPTIESVARRVKFVPLNDLPFLSFIVTKAFENYFPDDNSEGKDGAPYAKFQLFLIELLLAARRKRNIVSVVKIPDAKTIESALPTDLHIIINSLFSTFKSHDVTVAASNIVINETNIKFFDEIIIGLVYKEYKRAHMILEGTDTPSLKAIKTIEKASISLVKRYPSLLNIKKTIVNILPITTKLIDGVFGKLPGSIAEISSKILSSWLSDNKQIIIYEFPELLKMTMRTRVSALADKKSRGKK